ncbi:MAG: hypothetical protein AVDCRST_MAG11-4042, partial [uncultured Gemmatimonadaceae bacterium]
PARCCTSRSWTRAARSCAGPARSPPTPRPRARPRSPPPPPRRSRRGSPISSRPP